MVTAPQQQALASLKGLLASGNYSDLTITCGQDTFKIHKAVVCGRAGFFACAIRFGGQEAKSGVIDLPEDEPEVIRLLVQYLYEAEYNPVLPTGGQGGASVAAPPREAGYHYDFPHSCRGANRVVNNTVLSVSCTKRIVCPHHACGAACRFNCHYFSCEICTAPASLPLSLPLPAGTAEDLLLHAKMYEVADKYDIPDLKDLAKAKFDASCRHFWDTPSFAIAARHAFSTTFEDDRGLRDIVSATVSEHLELVNDLEVGAVMDEFNGLALGILRATIGEQGHKK